MVSVESFGDTKYACGSEFLSEDGLVEKQYVSNALSSDSLRGSGRRERGGKTSRPPKMRQKKYNLDGELEDSDDIELSNSLMKRRRKTELHIQVDSTGQTVAPPHSVTFNDMGPPDDTPRKVFKFKGSKDVVLNGPLESPLSLDKDVSFDGSFNIAADTPTLSKLMNLIPTHSSKPGSTLTSDSLRFDFDEI
ncbi:unnamed protein product, partial [Symbiodinium microadriaticum]